MKFATWNANSICARIGHIIAFLERSEIDALAIQEVKYTPEQFPVEPFTAVGYKVVIHDLNQWSDVAIASRLPIVKVQDHFADQPGFGKPKVVEARAPGAVLRGENEKEACIRDLHAPSGRELDHPHYAYKLDWLHRLRSDVQSWFTADPRARIAAVGDWSVAPFGEDVWDMSAFDGATHVSEPGRQVFFVSVEDRWTEVICDRVTNYTFWGYQRLRLLENEGTRIDFVYASPALAPSVFAAQIDYSERKGEGASDHVPVIITLKD